MKIEKIQIKRIQETEYGLEHWLVIDVSCRKQIYQVHQLVLTSGFVLSLTTLEKVILLERRKEIKMHIKIIRALENCEDNQLNQLNTPMLRVSLALLSEVLKVFNIFSKTIDKLYFKVYNKYKR